MILLRLLDHDLHTARKSLAAVPLWLETPARPEFVPAVVSLSRPVFSVNRSLREGRLRSGVFQYDSDRIDEVIPDMLRVALRLSESDSFPNRFADPADAFAYIQSQSGLKNQPHAVIVPASWGGDEIVAWGQGAVSKSDGSRSGMSSTYSYAKSCHVLSASVDVPVFFSRPDFVGMYTQFIGGRSSIVLHNVKSGLAFCTPP